MSLSRRQFIVQGTAVSAGVTLGGILASAGPAGAFPVGGYGPLLTDPASIVNLPAGFSYKVLALRTAIGATPATQLGTRVPAENAGAVPGAPDGMASFYDPTTKRTYLVCNHELSTGAGVPKTFRGSAVPTYDALSGANGGCTTIVMDENMDVIEHVPSIAGTIRNCAGGPTPWGTWLTCEEDSSSISAARAVNHGYLFEVDPKTGLTNAAAYKQMGRANHEAVAIDPSTSDAYITEDAGGGLLYKFVPTDTTQQFGSLGNGGTLYAMKVPGITDFAQLTTIGQSVSGVTWTQAVNPDVTGLNATFDSSTVTRGTKLEGAWWINGALWFVQSFSGTANSGGVFKYEPATSTITVITRIAAGGQNVTLTDGTTTQTHLIRDPDNIGATPYGGAIWSQDGGDPQYLVCLSPDGTFFPVAQNPGGGEWAGAHFSLDGKWLFASQQGRGLTVAITGPWAATEPPVVPEFPVPALAVGAAAVVGGLIAFRHRRVQPSEM